MQMEEMARRGYGAEDIAVKLDVSRENAWRFVQIYGGKNGRADITRTVRAVDAGNRPGKRHGAGS